MKRDLKMRNDDENEQGKMTDERTLKMLKDEGVEVTLEQARLILEFLRKLASITVSNYLKRKQ